MKFTYDDKYLITVSKDSCIALWRVQDKDGRKKYNDAFSFAQEVLITKSELEDKVQFQIANETKGQMTQNFNSLRVALACPHIMPFSFWRRLIGG